MMRRFVWLQLVESVRVEKNAARSAYRAFFQLLPKMGIIEAAHGARQAYLIRRYLEMVCGPEPKKRG